MKVVLTYHDNSVFGFFSPQIDNMFTSLICIGEEGNDDVAEAVATTCVVNTKLRRVAIWRISPLPVMKSLASRQVLLEELEIYPPWVC